MNLIKKNMCCKYYRSQVRLCVCKLYRRVFFKLEICKMFKKRQPCWGTVTIYVVGYYRSVICDIMDTFKNVGYVFSNVFCLNRVHRCKLAMHNKQAKN